MGKTGTHIFVSVPHNYIRSYFSNEVVEEVLLCLTTDDGNNDVPNHASALVENSL